MNVINETTKNYEQKNILQNLINELEQQPEACMVLA